MSYFRRDDGFFECIPNHSSIVKLLEVWKNLHLEYELPVIDISGKREDCEDPDQTSGGDDCGDTRGG